MVASRLALNTSLNMFAHGTALASERTKKFWENLPLIQEILDELAAAGHKRFQFKQTLTEQQKKVLGVETRSDFASLAFFVSSRIKDGRLMLNSKVRKKAELGVTAQPSARAATAAAPTSPQLNPDVLLRMPQRAHTAGGFSVNGCPNCLTPVVMTGTNFCPTCSCPLFVVSNALALAGQIGFKA